MEQFEPLQRGDLSLQRFGMGRDRAEQARLELAPQDGRDREYAPRRVGEPIDSSPEHVANGSWDLAPRVTRVPGGARSS
jgi:hypothetical protein